MEISKLNFIIYKGGAGWKNIPGNDNIANLNFKNGRYTSKSNNKNVWCVYVTISIPCFFSCVHIGTYTKINLICSCSLEEIEFVRNLSKGASFCPFFLSYFQLSKTTLLWTHTWLCNCDSNYVPLPFVILFAPLSLVIITHSMNSDAFQIAFSLFSVFQ